LVLLAGLLAEATRRIVEDPVRFGALLRPNRRALACGAVLIAVTTTGCAALGEAVPVSTGNGHAATIALPQSAHLAAPARTGAGLPVPSPQDAAVARAVAAAVRSRPVPANLAPSLDGAAADKAAPFVDGCHLSWTDNAQPPCVYTQGRPLVVLLGDSHATQWFPSVRTVALRHTWHFESLTKTACPPIEARTYSPYLGRDYTECTAWLAAMIARLRAQRPALVIIGVARHYGPQIGFDVYSATWNTALAATVREIRASTGAHVLVLGPTPKPPADVPTCLSAHLDDAAVCDFARATGVNAAGEQAERAAVRAAGGDYLDVAPWVCTSSTCAVVVGPNLVYRDDNHLTTTFTSWLAPVLDVHLQSLIGG
jgi:hypothetical protein